MATHSLFVSLQVILPTAAFGAVILAAGSRRLARLLGLRRRPFRVGKRHRSIPSVGKGAPRLLSAPMRPTPPPRAYSEP